eukprot:TRINITY_DN1422_c0_g1_i4.p1 TRINITY_DN1422_c0_g1~~TRINITY_DN1422_c0_g1_i4.p1  ORF type:complete len:341 (-),score=65.72 TRINITY_DN1422_c0_g1_i4:354-1376(-)
MCIRDSINAEYGGNTSAMSLPLPKLVVTSQESLEQEIVSKNGIQKNVHAVIKNQPFKMIIDLEEANAHLNFRLCSLGATLVYDTEKAKAVDFVRKNPLEYETTIAENQLGIAATVTVLMRLSVLSSQHEDMFFRVRFNLKCDKLNLCVLSDPIKVVSKPAQLKKNKEPRKRKRTPNDSINETLARIETQQREQQALISSLVQSIKSNPTQSLINNSADLPNKRLKLAKTEKDSEDTSIDFEQHLKGLIQAFNFIPLEQRHQIIRNVMTNCSSENHERLSEVIDCLWVEGLQKQVVPGNNIETGSPFPNTVLNENNAGQAAINKTDQNNENSNSASPSKCG